jgi:MFS family permease
MRFLAGLGGSACLTIGTGVIADLFIASQRGKAVAVYSIGILFGPILGPICGGFIAQRAGWRWDMWVVLIVAVLLTAGLFVFNRETNHSVLLNRKTLRLRTELERPELQNVMNAGKPAAALTPKAILLNGITRPLKMLTTSLIVLLCSLYMSFLFGLLFLLFTTLTPVFLQTYGWAPEMTGLAYLGIGIGNFLGIGFVARTSDATIVKLAKRNKGVYEPEMRLPLCVFFGFLIPVSFFLYGWVAYYKVHWIGKSSPTHLAIYNI